MGSECVDQIKDSVAEVATDRAQRGAQNHAGREHRGQEFAFNACGSRDAYSGRNPARDTPARGSAAPAGAQTIDASGGSRDVIDLAG